MTEIPGLRSFGTWRSRIGVLVTFHEYRPFFCRTSVAVSKCTAFFSIGFGRPLWSRVGQVMAPNTVLAAIPLGGYVASAWTIRAEVEVRTGMNATRPFHRQAGLAEACSVAAAGPAANLMLLAVSGVLDDLPDRQARQRANDRSRRRGTGLVAEAGFIRSETRVDTPSHGRGRSRVLVRSQCRSYLKLAIYRRLIWRIRIEVRIPRHAEMVLPAVRQLDRSVIAADEAGPGRLAAKSV